MADDASQGQVPDARGQEPQQTPPQEAAPADARDGQEPEPERFDAEYVRRLRAEAAEYRKRLREFEQAQKAAEEAKLSGEERLQKRLSELERAEATWQQERQERTLRYETLLAAQRLGLVDPEAAYKLLDLASVEFDDDGKPKNLEKLLRDLVRARPWLAGQGVASIGATNPALGGAQRGTFTTSQIADRKFYETHRAEILQALAEGRIVPG
jgi:hypothetical protein